MKANLTARKAILLSEIKHVNIGNDLYSIPELINSGLGLHF